MKALSINKTKVLQLVRDIRQLSKLSLDERRQAVDTLLKEIDVLQIDVEHLVCIKHALSTTGHASHSSAYRSSQYQRLHIFRICCRDYFDKRELALIPKAGKRGRVAKVKVGMLGK